MIGTNLLVILHLLAVDAYFKCSSDADCNYVGCVCSSLQIPESVGGWSVCPGNGIDSCLGHRCGLSGTGESYCSTWYHIYSSNVDKCSLGPTESTSSWCLDPPTCHPGLYSSDGYDRVVNPCQGCPAGSFSSSLGASFCTSCGPGLFSVISGGTSCSMCSAGTYYNRTGVSPRPAFYSDIYLINFG
jgi:hypothetical protein